MGLVDNGTGTQKDYDTMGRGHKGARTQWDGDPLGLGHNETGAQRG